METTIKFDTAQINDNARWMLEIAKEQSFDPDQFNNEVITLFLESSSGINNCFYIHVEDTLTWSERAREFGVDDLPPWDCSGKFSDLGNPIPNEEYIQNRLREMSDVPNPRTFSCPEWIVLAVECQDMDGLEAINRIGDRFAKFLKQGKFIPG
jgi:hypothetical protein